MRNGRSGRHTCGDLMWERGNLWRAPRLFSRANAGSAIRPILPGYHPDLKRIFVVGACSVLVDRETNARPEGPVQPSPILSLALGELQIIET
jgi:hypothetical protein